MYRITKRERITHGEILKVKFPLSPKPGQFMTVLLDGKEIPVGVYDYDEGELSIFMEKGNVMYNWLYLKGPLGSPLSFKGYTSVIGVSRGTLEHDLHYPLKVASKMGLESSLVHKIPEHVDDDTMILFSLPKEELTMIPPNVLRKSFVYIRWVKMNCAVGVCGVCNYRGSLPCVDGPFLKGEKLVA
ncbi:hypothetical protein [Sulfuracidifex tepidarius]|uniref:Dihydroorotate dehydrogenase B (NAD(+)), electron transfer subunit n=1 Tax=Sulfuracidifex tepidarius TaxID=1294262 RepID=A0A510E2T4_9CREN|nr:hypothetical protein [Sulfuracidifex tepidarius]BBG24032.1 hypothetical protein IC006_1333 [Sulfuracidifex tepidarius]BBG26787.1 hypothetical protein IC007_1308 [Sulfuracidifex tepidarius]